MSDTVGSSSFARRLAREWRLGLGAILLLIGIVNLANVRTERGGLAEALVVMAGCLIVSWLPKSTGNEELTRLRRRMWFRLAGLGLLVMVVLALGLAALSQFTAVVLVTWAYWFGWIWVSWPIADTQAQRQIRQSSP